MKKNIQTLLFLAGFLWSGCAALPFEPVRLGPVDGLDPARVREDFREKLADPFEVVESVIFTYGRRKITALGHSQVNAEEKTLAVAGMTPLGAKVFEIKSAGDKVESSFSIPEMEKKVDREKMAQAMAEDVRRVYFTRIPAEEAEVFKSKGRIYYRQAAGPGKLEFIFGGPQAALIEKSYEEGGRKLWRVRYFEYRTEGSRIYPSKIFYENPVGKYSLALRLKEILA